MFFRYNFDGYLLQQVIVISLQIKLKLKLRTVRYVREELDGPAVSALRHVIAEVKQRWSVIG
jgi:hypothetical protein